MGRQFNELGHLVRHLVRERADGISSQTELAEKTGISIGRLSGLIKRGDYTPESAMKVIGAFSGTNQQALLQAYFGDFVREGRSFGIDDSLIEWSWMPARLVPLIKDIVWGMENVSPHLESALRGVAEMTHRYREDMQTPSDKGKGSGSSQLKAAEGRAAYGADNNAEEA